MLQKLNWLPLEERRARAKTTLLFKALNNLVEIPISHLTLTQNFTRQHKNFFIPYARTDTHRHSFYLSAIRLWNTLPTSTQESKSLDRFKHSIGSHTFRNRY